MALRVKYVILWLLITAATLVLIYLALLTVSVIWPS